MGNPRHAAALFALLTSIATAQTQPSPTSVPSTEPFPVAIEVDLAQPIAPWKPVYRFFGCDEPNYVYMPAGKALITELGKLGTPDEPVYFRTHNLMTTGDGTPALKWGSTNLYTEKPDGTPVYDYTIVDRIFDTYLAAGVKPYLQLGFMPEAMSTHPQPYQHHWDPSQKYDAIFTGWAYPPKDYGKWEELCYQWTKHCVERYGKAEVERWYFEVWNEPNGYWKGTFEEFAKLHDHAVAGVRRALPTARVGGPDTAGDGGKFSDQFLAHVLTEKNQASGETGTPTDFVSFHAKGAPTFTHEGFVRMGVAAQLQTMERGFKRFAALPKVKPLPIVIGESDPEGCAACQGRQNGYRNGTMYASYTAESFARGIALADKHGVNLVGMLTWAFEFEGYPPFAGFRVLASGLPGGQIIDHPVLNVFRMMSQFRGDRVRVTSDHASTLDDVTANGVRGQPDVDAMATTTPGRATVMLWHYHDDDVAGPDAAITLTLRGFTRDVGRMRYSEQRIDATHGNAYTAWQAMGSPANPSAAQIEQLQQAGALATSDDKHALTTVGNVAHLTVTLPRQGVSLITVEWDVR